MRANGRLSLVHTPLLLLFPKTVGGIISSKYSPATWVRAYFDLGVNSVYLAVKIMRDWIYRLLRWTSSESVSGNEYMAVSMHARTLLS